MLSPSSSSQLIITLPLTRGCRSDRPGYGSGSKQQHGDSTIRALPELLQPHGIPLDDWIEFCRAIADAETRGTHKTIVFVFGFGILPALFLVSMFASPYYNNNNINNNINNNSSNSNNSGHWLKVVWGIGQVLLVGAIPLCCWAACRADSTGVLAVNEACEAFNQKSENAIVFYRTKRKRKYKRNRRSNNNNNDRKGNYERCFFLEVAVTIDTPSHNTVPATATTNINNNNNDESVLRDDRFRVISLRQFYTQQEVPFSEDFPKEDRFEVIPLGGTNHTAAAAVAAATASKTHGFQVPSGITVHSQEDGVEMTSSP